MPNPTITRATITTSRQLLRLEVRRGDGSSALGHVSAVAPTVKLSVDGVETTYSHPLFSAGWSDVGFPLCPERSRSRADDSDVGSSHSGTIVEHTPFAGVGGRFDANDATNSQFKTLAGPSDWFQWPALATPSPGRCSLMAKVHGLVDSDRATQATYVVSDSLGAEIARFAVDLSTAPDPTLRRDVDGQTFLFVGHFEVPEGSTTVSVRLLNGGGSGVLVADEIAIDSDFAYAVPDGATVTAILASGAATVDGTPTDAVTLPVTFAGDDDLLWPIKAPGARTIKVGLNTDPSRLDSICVGLADRSLGSNKWVGAVTLDAHFEMVACTGDAIRPLLNWAGDGLTPGGVHLMGDGVVWWDADYSGATFDDAARSRISLATDIYTVGSVTWTHLSGARWRGQCEVTRKPLLPISQRTSAYSYQWSGTINLFSQGNPGLLITDQRWYGPDTPVGYTGTANPVHVAQFGGKIGPLRSMDEFGINGSPACVVGDFLSPADRRIPDQTDGAEYYPAGCTILAIRPADTDAGTDADRLHDYYDPNGGLAWCVVTVDDATPFQQRDCLAANIFLPTQDYPSTVPGVSVRLSNVLSQHYLDSTHLLLCVFPSDGYVANPAGGPQVFATLAATHDLTGQGGAIYLEKTCMLPVETYVARCRDLGAIPWICVPHGATDDFVAWEADAAIAGTPDGTELLVELSNEHWNPGFPQYRYFNIKALQYNKLHAADPTTYPYEYNYGSVWYAHRAAQVRDIFRARMTAAGRDPDLIKGLVGTQQLNGGISDGVAYAMEAETLTFEGATVSSYQGISPSGSDFLGPDLAATFRRLGVQGNIDVAFISAFAGPLPGIYATHRAIFAGRGFGSIPFYAYEGGWDYPTYQYDDFAWASRICPAINMDPRQYKAEASFASLLQDSGFAVHVPYKLAGTHEAATTHVWTLGYSALPALGTGDPAERGDWTDAPRARSQRLAGIAAFGGGVDFAAADDDDGGDDDTAPPAGILMLGTSAGFSLFGVG